jgi:hypothetical protein
MLSMTRRERTRRLHKRPQPISRKGHVAWKAAKNAIFKRSTAESESIAAGEIAKELQYVQYRAAQFGLFLVVFLSDVTTMLL